MRTLQRGSRRWFLCIAVLLCMLATAWSATCLLLGQAEWVDSITRYEVIVPQRILNIVKVANPGIGSSLTFKHKDEQGHFYFYALTDRGPNLQAPALSTGQEAIIFMEPDFQPFISLVKVTPLEASVEAVVVIQSHALPSRSCSQADTAELPLTLDLVTLKANGHGLDLEAIDIQGDAFWVADEYGPSLVKINRAGEIVRTITFGSGLPEILKARIENKGIEAMAITPSGKLIFALESVLNINGETKDCAAFVRIVELDLETLHSRMFAYAFDANTYNSPVGVRIGDIAIIDEDKWLIIEQGKTLGGGWRNTIQLVDSRGATDISDVKGADGRELEYSGAEALRNVR
ncbi:MAG TPA: esterase-like activity of phytase family protein, partial [Opitutales bacterium]|nr:esterase-like activity of phytase family protein [Opitutales bacterium]